MGAGRTGSNGLTIALIVIGFLQSACQNNPNYKYHDPSLETKAQDYEAQLTQTKAVAASKTLQKPVDKSQQIPAEFQKPVSLNTSAQVPLSELFLALAQQAKVNMIVSPDIKVGATIHAQNRPLIDLVKELCASHGLRYRINGSMLKIEVDKPFLKTYNVEFLILTRTNHNRFAVATDVFTTAEGYQGDEDNGANTSLIAETKTDFWQELTDNLNVLLQQVDESAPPPRFTIHKQGGLISIAATQAQHDEVGSYLQQLRRSVERQVLIEAKIVEVNLNDEYQSGINWNVVKSDFVTQSPMGALATPGSFDENLTPQRNVFTIGGASHKITGLLSLLKRFGTVRTLSNPRLTVINNQSAVLKVATNKVYFKLNYSKDYNYSNEKEQTYVSSEARTVPIGLVMVVQPSIQNDTGKIIMTIRPTISRIIQEVADPAVGIASSQKQVSYVPEVQVKEVDTVLSMNTGETVVVGGLMEESADNKTAGVPEAEDVPLLGNLFSAKDNNRKITELVIFLKATMIDNSDMPSYVESSSVAPADAATYHHFTKDPRPLNF